MEEVNNEVVIFEAYLSNSANVFKNLIELLSQVAPIKKSDHSNKSVKQAFFKITKSGIYINIDHQNDILINIAVDSDKFSSYKYNFGLSELNIGITLDIIKDAFKNVKKSEGVALCIRKKIHKQYPMKYSFPFLLTITTPAEVLLSNLTLCKTLLFLQWQTVKN